MKGDLLLAICPTDRRAALPTQTEVGLTVLFSSVRVLSFQLDNCVVKCIMAMIRLARQRGVSRKLPRIMIDRSQSDEL